MGYEYKEEILLDIGPAPSYNYPSEAANYYAKINELDHVYAQAAEYKEYRADAEKLYNALKAKGEKEILKYKAIADEYEAKAKAWDLLKLKLDGKNKSILRNPKASDEDLDFVGNNTAVLWEMSDLEMKFRKEYESGE